MPVYITKYNTKWELEDDPYGLKYGDWACKGDETNAWCKLCKKYIDIKSMGKSALKQHAGNREHKVS